MAVAASMKGENKAMLSLIDTFGMYVLSPKIYFESVAVEFLVRRKYWPAWTESQSKICCAWTATRAAAAVSFCAMRTMTLDETLKVGKVRKVADTMTPQLPAPPPRNA